MRLQDALPQAKLRPECLTVRSNSEVVFTSRKVESRGNNQNQI